ncbi:hypothetical protein ElyMa_006000700 [Elysia marginata]|uniref:Uncharacterized protein n=1 Tax=Elysia marginata TaxID=1093978 RepID=A0AAV4GFC9_9GAST|nr:hypothetical protein ElyMa_006000700 [Elysia marginata]
MFPCRDTVSADIPRRDVIDLGWSGASQTVVPGSSCIDLRQRNARLVVVSTSDWDVAKWEIDAQIGKLCGVVV